MKGEEEAGRHRPTDGPTDRQTDRRTDRQIDSPRGGEIRGSNPLVEHRTRPCHAYIHRYPVSLY